MKIVTTLHKRILVEYIPLCCGMIRNKSFTVPSNTTTFSVEIVTYFMFKPCIDMTSLSNNQLMHSQFHIY